MTQIVRLINDYIQLHKSIFPLQENKTIYYFKDTKNTNTLNINTQYTRGFTIVLGYQYYNLIITNHYHNTNFRILENLNNIIFEECLSVLQTFIFLCGVGGIPFWSEAYRKLIDFLKLNNVSVKLIELDQCYDIVPLNNECKEKQFKMFKEYILMKYPGLRTKDSDFLLKYTYNSFYDPSPEQKSLLCYLEKYYTGFIYGYVELAHLSTAETIFNFWFKDLFLVHCDFGIGHLEGGAFCLGHRFYFLLACKNSVIVESAINKLMREYKIILLEYTKGPVAFIEEFMHYKSQVSFLNHYFIGVYNKEDWVLFLDVFQKISHEINDNVRAVEYAIVVEDDLTIEENYHLRFASLLYSLLYDVPQALSVNNVPWFALPKPLVQFIRKEDI